MRRPYNKLVRDRIPELIAQDGRTYAMEDLDETAYLHALLAKLVEEAQEVMDAAPEERITELADLLEVMDALVGVMGIDESRVRAVQRARRVERGGFSRRLKLLWIEEA